MSSRELDRVPLAVRLFPLRQRITLTVYLTVLFALVVGVGAWMTTQLTRTQVAALNDLIDASAEVRQYRTHVDEMQFASYRFIASNHGSAADRVDITYRQTRESMQRCIDTQCAGEQANARVLELLQYLDAFHQAFVEAVEQRRAIEISRDGRFRELLAETRAAIPKAEAADNTNVAEALNSFNRFLDSIEDATDKLGGNSSPSSGWALDFEQMRTVLAQVPDALLLQPRAQVEDALDELTQLYRQLLQRSRGHRFLVNVVMAGDAHEMQMIAELLEEELAAEIAAAQGRIDQRLRAYTLGVIALLLLGSALVFFVGRVMANSVSGQIRRLSRIFSQLAAGSEMPIRFASPHRDEIDELARAAERFREENVESRALLDRYSALNAELESKVAQRTQALASSNARLETLANTDRLTGVSNRRALDSTLNAEFERCQRYQHSLSLLFLDLDRFKQVNDAHGHAVGDEVLQKLVVELRGLLRESDVLGRWGGEEFIVVCPETDSAEALHLAERLRIHIDALEFRGVGKVTVSIGAADFRPGDSIQDLVDRADQALYQAKLQGRNRCVLAT